MDTDILINNIIQSACEEIDNGKVDFKYAISSFLFNEGRYGNCILLLPVSSTLLDEFNKYKSKSSNREFVSMLIQGFDEWLAFPGEKNGEKIYFMCMKPGEVGYTGRPRYFFPKKLISISPFDRIYKEYIKLIGSNFINNGIKYCGEVETFSAKQVVDIVLDIKPTYLDFMSGFGLENFASPISKHRVMTNDGDIFLLIPKTNVLMNKLNEERHTYKWLIQCATQQWKTICFSDGGYIRDLDSATGTFTIGDRPNLFIMPCLFEYSFGKEILDMALFDKINNFIEFMKSESIIDKDFSYEIESVDSNIIIDMGIMELT